MNWKRVGVVALFMAGMAHAREPARPFYAFCMDTHDAKKRTIQQQAELLKELGYDGCGHLWLDNVPERLKTLDAAGLKLFQLYAEIKIVNGKPVPDLKIKEVLPLLKGRGAQLALLIPGARADEHSLDEPVAEVIREIAAMAEPVGVEVVLYPHTAQFIETVQDALRLADKVDRPNVGVMFNLCHWLNVSKDRNYRAVLEQAMPRLLGVSINGADEHYDKPDWTTRYIQPLGDGTFNVGEVLTTLDALGYKRPIGLQCWGLGGDAREHLTRSITAWRELHQKASGEK